MSIIYTELEHTVKKYKVKDAVSSARYILKDRYNVSNLNEQYLSFRKLTLDTPITVVELNQISDKLIADSLSPKRN